MAFTLPKVLRVDLCESTQNEALNLLKSSSQNTVAVIAASMRAGRGRRGNTWFSPPGGLYLSLGIRTDKIELVKKLPFLTAHALMCTLRLFNISHVLKWPNDILIESPTGALEYKLKHYKKIAGILIENYQQDNFIQSVIGIGVNLQNSNNLQIPPEIQSKVAFLDNLSALILEPILIEHLLAELNADYSAIQFARLVKTLETHCCLIGATIKLNPTDTETVKVLGFDTTQGALIVRTQAGTTETIFSINA
jgi:BirA family biotin operon repressor/biotin-[acetyl-CoA-carboxylase] ligase